MACRWTSFITLKLQTRKFCQFATACSAPAENTLAQVQKSSQWAAIQTQKVAWRILQTLGFASFCLHRKVSFKFPYSCTAKRPNLDGSHLQCSSWKETELFNWTDLFGGRIDWLKKVCDNVLKFEILFPCFFLYMLSPLVSKLLTQIST